MARKIGQFRTARLTPERVLREKGLAGRATVTELATAASAHDNTNRGYLSEKELRKGADDLLEVGSNTNPSYRFSSRTLAGVQNSVLKPNTLDNLFTGQEIVDSAARWDDGNGYLNKKELMAGAIELQLRETNPVLRSTDLAAIRAWSGVSSTGPQPD